MKLSMDDGKINGVLEIEMQLVEKWMRKWKNWKGEIACNLGP